MTLRCEDVATGPAAGGPFRRWRARRHAARCPRCASLAADLRRIAAELAAAPPPTPAQRRLWMAACDDVATPVESRRLRPAALRIAAAAAILALAFVAYRLRTPPPSPSIGPTPPAVAIAGPGPGRDGAMHEAEELRQGVASLLQELDSLGREADLLDVRRDLEDLGRQFASLGEDAAHPRP